MKYPSLILVFLIAVLGCEQNTGKTGNWNEYIQVLLDSMPELDYSRGDRLPLYFGRTQIGELSDREAENLIKDLDERGIGLACAWDQKIDDEAISRCLTVAGAQQKNGLRVNINANRLLNYLYDGDQETAHIDSNGDPFFDDSFGSKHKMGCPFTLDSRKREIRERVEYYVNKYSKQGLSVDFIYADWEIDGPLETNGAYEAAKKCTRCRRYLGNEFDFSDFQQRMREMRSYLQYYEYSMPVLSHFPGCLIGNYAVYPGDGYRYWYDYFEYYTEEHPCRMDQEAKYRKWYNEFPATGFTCSMPVVYTWFPIYNWYDFENSDYRWFYNMLLVASNAGRNTPRNIPIISSVTWHTVWVKFGGGYREPDPATLQLSQESYQELLWHMLLRGTSSFKVYSAGIDEFPTEARLVHQVYSAAQKYGEFLDRGLPINFDVPGEPGTVVSGLILDDRVLVRRTDFSDNRKPVELMAGTRSVKVEYAPGTCRILKLSD